MFFFMYCIILFADITQDKARKMTKTVEQIKKLMGAPRNYGMCK